MSRGGRGGRGGGRGGLGGRGGFGANNLPPMGLTFADIQNMSREAGDLYPAMDPLPVLTSFTDEEKRIIQLQNGFATRLRQSAYYVVESVKSDELPRYSDKYRPSPAAQPTLKRKDLHQPFFPGEIFEDYFNPKRRKKLKKIGGKKVVLDDIADGDEDQEKSDEERSDAGSQEPESDYDDEDENDYEDNYFDNGEEDNLDDMGGGLGNDNADYD